MLLTTLAPIPAFAQETASERTSTEPESEDSSQIIVRGRRPDPLVGLVSDDALDEADIEAYGFDTVGELISEISEQVDPSRSGPVILIDGQPASGINDVRDLPVEAVQKVELFGSAAAVRLGQSPGRQVVNISLKSSLLQWTSNLSGAVGTDGGFAQSEMSQSRFNLRHGNRDLLSGEGQWSSAIDESERDVAPLTSTVAYPAELRTLRPAEKQFAANTSIARNLSENANFALTLRYEHDRANGRNGPAVVAITDDHGITSTTMLGFALLDQASSDRLSSNLTFNTIVGTWQVSVLGNGNFRWAERSTQTGYEPLALVGTEFPNVLGSLPSLQPIVNQSEDSSQAMNVQGIATGPVMSLPTGALMLTAKAEWQQDHFRTSYDGPGRDTSRRFNRGSGRATLAIAAPLSAEGSPVGALDMDLTSSLRQISNFGSAFEYGAGLNWEPGPNLRLELRFSEERDPPAASYVSDAPVLVPNYTVFDFLRNETVAVDYIIGGNQSLPIERSREWSAQIRYGPVARTNFTVEYTRSQLFNSASSLPPINAEVQAAFPDRFVRDTTGRLVLVDARSIAFAQENEETLRFGLDLRRTLAGARVGTNPASTGTGPSDTPARAGLLRANAQGIRVNFRFNYRMLLSSERQARSGLPIVDLLDGGAPGYGSGVARHRVDFSAGLASKGVGLRAEGTWRGSSEIRSGSQSGFANLKFASLAGVNLRGFANMSPIFPASGWMKGARISLDILNLFNAKQQVSSYTGETPLGYQPALIDPVGRTASLSLRKIF